MENIVFEFEPIALPVDAIHYIKFDKILIQINNIIENNEEYRKSKKKMHIKHIRQPLITIIEPDTNPEQSRKFMEYYRQHNTNISEIKNSHLNELITLQDIPSELDGLTLHEQPDIEALDKLLNSDLLQTSSNNGHLYERDKEQLEEYKNLIDANGIIKITYKKQKDMKMGRVYASGNLGAINLRKEIRSTLFNKQYVDIDIVNSQPTIFYQISKILKLNCPSLGRYITHREDVLQEIQHHYNVNRVNAKELIIILLFHGSFGSWARDNQIDKPQLEIIKDITRDLLAIEKEIITNNPELITRVKSIEKNKHKNQFQINKTTISYYAHEIENRILEEIYKYCIEHILITNGKACLCYDGIMILKDNYTPDLLIELNKIIYNKYGLDLKFEEKQTQSYLAILDEHIIEPVNEIALDIDVSSVYPIDSSDQNRIEYQLLDLIDPKIYRERSKILSVLGHIIKLSVKFNNALNIWIHLCVNAGKTNITKMIKQWESFKKTFYTFNTIRAYARQTDQKRMYELLRIHKMEQIYNIHGDNNNVIEIDTRYLLDKDKGLDDDTILCKNIKKFARGSNVKTLNIRSPYDTGKTQLLKQYISKYNPKRILWLSYRKTLTSDIHSNFHSFGFESYTDKKFNADRLIIQLESLLHIDGKCPTDEFLDDEEPIETVPVFDLIVIDEIESILNQFASNATFKDHNNERVFEYMDQIIKTSLRQGKKMITMDGDMSERSYSFLSRFGESINIYNSHMFNNFTFKILPSSEAKAFEDMIKADIIADKNLFIPSMSNTYATALEVELNKIPNKAVMLYNKHASDKTKEEDMKNIASVWSKLNCVITTPTIEAGVSFDAPHFHKIYAVICEGSCSQRSFFQMLARVRKVEEMEIIILNKSDFKLNNCNPWTYDEVKEKLESSDDPNIRKTIYIERDNDTLMKHNQFILTSYTSNYIYNRVEFLNKCKFMFLTIFKFLAEKKGFEFEIIQVDKKKKDEEVIIVEDPINSSLDSKILNAADISEDEFEELSKKQKQSELEQHEHYILEKHYIKRKTGLDILTLDIVIKFRHGDKIRDFTCLIDRNNQHNGTILSKDEEMSRHNYIIAIINKLGFKNIYDDKIIKNSEFEQNIRDTIEFLINEYTTNKKFDLIMNKSRHYIPNMRGGTLKALLGFINTHLSIYSVKISIMRKRERGVKNKISCYGIEILDNIEELLEYRMNKGFRIHDSDNIFVKPSERKSYNFKYNANINTRMTIDPIIHDISVDQILPNILVEPILHDTPIDPITPDISIDQILPNILVEPILSNDPTGTIKPIKPKNHSNDAEWDKYYRKLEKYRSSNKINSDSIRYNIYAFDRLDRGVKIDKNNSINPTNDRVIDRFKPRPTSNWHNEDELKLVEWLKTQPKSFIITPTGINDEYQQACEIYCAKDDDKQIQLNIEKNKAKETISKPIKKQYNAMLKIIDADPCYRKPEVMLKRTLNRIKLKMERYKTRYHYIKSYTQRQ